MPRTLLLAALFLSILGPGGARAEQALRMTELALRDPHMFAPLPILGCRDVTDVVPLHLADSFNETVAISLTEDTNSDGFLELNPMIYFPPSDDAVGTTVVGSGIAWDPDAEEGEVVFHVGRCTAPLSDTACDPDLVNPVHWLGWVSSTAGGCLEPIPGSTSAYDPPITVPGGACFVTEPFEVSLAVGGFPIVLEWAQMAANRIPGPPAALTDGLLRGFLRESIADSTILPEHIAYVGGQPLSVVLPGGTGSCAVGDDRDLAPDSSELGWWIYMNFEAIEVPFIASTFAPDPSVGRTALQLAPVRPNPTRGAASISFVLPERSPVDLAVFDVTGRRVATLGAGSYPAGTTHATWDGTGSRGSAAAAGIYFVRLETPRGVVTRKLVRSR